VSDRELIEQGHIVGGTRVEYDEEGNIVAFLAVDHNGEPETGIDPVDGEFDPGILVRGEVKEDESGEITGMVHLNARGEPFDPAGPRSPRRVKELDDRVAALSKRIEEGVGLADERRFEELEEELYQQRRATEARAAELKLAQQRANLAEREQALRERETRIRESAEPYAPPGYRVLKGQNVLDSLSGKGKQRIEAQRKRTPGDAICAYRIRRGLAEVHIFNGIHLVGKAWAEMVEGPKPSRQLPEPVGDLVATLNAESELASLGLGVYWGG
jgi:hypothetical protein